MQFHQVDHQERMIFQATFGTNKQMGQDAASNGVDFSRRVVEEAESEFVVRGRYIIVWLLYDLISLSLM